MAVFICQAADDPVPAEAGVVVIPVDGGACAGLLEEAPGAGADQVLGQEQGNAAAAGLVLHEAEGIGVRPADGIADGRVADLLRVGTHELLEAVDRKSVV